jgi:hypothetical protein
MLHENRENETSGKSKAVSRLQVEEYDIIFK